MLLAVAVMAQIAMHAALAGAYVFTDELNYLSYGKMVYEGRVIYRDFSEAHPPGNAFIAAILHALPDPFLAARLLVCAVQVAVTLCIFLIGLRLSGKPAAAAAALLYALWEPMFGGALFVAEPFVALLFSVGVLCAIWWRNRAGLGGLLLWGFSAGTALVFKLKAGWFPLASALLVLKFSRKEGTRNLAVFLAGVALPILALLAYLLAQNAVADAFNDLVIYNLTQKPYGDAGFFMMSVFEPYFLVLLILSVACAMAARWPFRKGAPATDMLLWGWFAAGMLMAFPRFNLFRAAVALPPLALMLADELTDPSKKGVTHNLAVLIAVLSAGIAAVVFAGALG